MRKYAIAAKTISAALVVALMSCSDQPTAVDLQSSREVQITVSPTQVALNTVGAQTTLTATVNGEPISNSSVAWTSADPSIVSVDANGRVSALGYGTGRVIATAKCCDRSATATITVASQPTIASISITPVSDTISVGSAAQLAATARDASGNVITGVSITWSTGNPEIVSVSSTGNVTGLAAGRALVTASAGGKSASSAITVVATSSTQPALASITISPSSETLNVGNSVQLAATARDANGNALSGYTFAWSTGNPEIVSVNASGVVTGLAPGNALVSASAGGKIASAAISVVAATKTCANLAISPQSLTLNYLGATGQLAATAYDNTGATMSGVSVSWSSLDTNVATVNTMGLVTAKNVGAALIVAAASNCAKADTIAAVVNQIVSSVQVTPTSVSLVQGDSVRLAGNALDAGGSPVPNTTLAWSTSSPTVATVDAAGKVKALNAGTAVISASAGGQIGSSSVVVSAPANQCSGVASVAISPQSLTLTSLGQTGQFGATVYDGSGNVTPNVGISWSSLNTGIATVSSTGMVTAKSVGAALVVALATGCAKADTVSVVVNQTVSSVAVTPTSASLVQGDSVRLAASASDAGGSAISNVSFTWSSSAPTIASVDSRGVVKALGAGSAVITASASGKTATASISVTAPSSPPPPSGGGTPDIAWADFENGTLGTFLTGDRSSNIGKPGFIEVIADPTGKFGGKVLRLHFVRSSTTASADDNRAIQPSDLTHPRGFGEPFYAAGWVYLPTPQSHMTKSTRKLFYLQRSTHDGYGVVMSVRGGDGATYQTIDIEFRNPAGGVTLIGNVGNLYFNTKTHLEMQVIPNTAVGRSDGVIRVWKDGVLIKEITSGFQPLWDNGTNKFNRFLIGQQTNETALYDEYRYWDNTAVSTTRIGVR